MPRARLLQCARWASGGNIHSPEMRRGRVGRGYWLDSDSAGHRIERNVRELIASVCEEAGERLFELRRNRLTRALRQAQRHLLSAHSGKARIC
jgi:hypothetical protein